MRLTKILKLFITLASVAFVIIIALYYSTFYVLPSVTVVNNSTTRLSTAQVTLPSSRLDFGAIPAGEANTLHYSLSQPTDGAYQYTFIKSDGEQYINRCGYVTNNEINKRVILTLESSGGVTCQ